MGQNATKTKIQLKKDCKNNHQINSNKYFIYAFYFLILNA